jgi:CRISPR/Cas system CSM-associated protein Csm4 (group 5 of RAMP superfamily)
LKESVQEKNNQKIKFLKLRKISKWKSSQLKKWVKRRDRKESKLSIVFQRQAHKQREILN